MECYTLIRQSRVFAYFVCAFFALASAYYILEMINGRNQMADFRVYYDACNQFLDGAQVYGQSYGVSSGFYKYSPLALIPFIPLAVLPYGIASVIYYLLVMFFFVEVAAQIFRVLQVPESGKKTVWFIILLSLFAIDHIERELHLGNVNLFLLVLCFWLMRSLSLGASFQSAIALSMLLLFKPHFLVLVPLLLWRIRWKELLYTAVFITIGVLLPAVYTGWNGNLALLHDWMSAIREHNTALESSPNTIYGLINSLISVCSIPVKGWIVVLVSLVITAIFALLYLLNTRVVLPDKRRWYLEIFMVVALIPNLTHTDTEHFIWSWPLIGFVVWNLLVLKYRWRPLYIILMALAFVPYVVNSPDIVGKEMMLLFDQGGGLGISNLIFVILSFLLVYFHRDEMKRQIQG